MKALSNMLTATTSYNNNLNVSNHGQWWLHHHQVSTPLQATQTTLSKTSFTVMKNDARRWIVEKIL